MSGELVSSTDFSDADVARLVQLASYANDLEHRPHVCLWETEGVVCNSQLQACELPGHLRSAHGVVSSDETPFMCRWVGCSVEMKKESIFRHVNERHLELRYVCPVCRGLFTRAHTMQAHVSSKHSGN